jgi:plasmid stabilization system protein ParE
MIRRLVIRAQAEAEFDRAELWYGAQSHAAAVGFVNAFRLALTRIVANPFQYQIVDDEIRRAPIARYPYGLLYAVSDDEIVILSCFHGSRDPSFWRGRPDR